MRYLNLLIVILVLGLFSSCQDSDDPVRTTPTIPGEGTWATLTMQTTGNNGLPDNHVTNLAFSQDGSAVIATPYALTFYDGTNWETKSLSQLSSGRFDEIYDLYSDRNGDIWITHTDGIKKLVNDELVEIPELQDMYEEIMFMDDLNKTFEDSNGTLWFSCTYYIISFDGSEWIIHDVLGNGDYGYNYHFSFIDEEGRVAVCDYQNNFHFWNGTNWNDMEPIADYDFTNVYEVFFDSNGTLYLKDFEEGYRMLIDGQLHHVSPNYHEYYSDQGRITILEDDEGTVWVNDGRLIRRKAMGEQWFSVILNDNRYVNEMVRAPDGKIWLATTHGLCIYDGETWSYLDADGLPDNVNNFICVDNMGTVWMANVNGIIRKDGNSWEIVNSSPQYEINDMQADSYGNIWIIGEYKLVRYNRNGDYQVYPGMAGDALYCSPNGDFYIGTQNGLYQYENGNMILIMDHFVHCITEYEGEILIGANFILNTNKELYPYCYDNTNFSQPVSGFHFSNYTNKIFPDFEGNLWCTSVGGISKYDGEKWVTYSSNESHVSDFEFNPLGIFQMEFEHVDMPVPGNCYWPVIDFFPSEVDMDGNIWFGFQKEIVAYDGKDFTVIEPDVLINSNIRDIDLMPNGDIWFITAEDGIVIYQP